MLFYADASALVKLVIDEPETEALRAHLRSSDRIATSRISLVEVGRATKLANPSEVVAQDAERIVRSCLLIDVTDDLLRSAASLSSLQLRALDAVHLATAISVEPDGVLVYDRRLAIEAENQGLRVAAPGAS